MNTVDFPHGLVDFGIAGSVGSTLVLGGPWAGSHAAERDLRDVQSLVVRERGVLMPWRELNFLQLLDHLPNLIYVDVEFEVVDDLAWVEHLPRLKHLGVRCKKIRRSTALSSLTTLTSLDISGQDELVALVHSGVEHLAVANFRGRNIVDLAASSLISLKLTTARHLEDLTALQGLNFLREIDIYSAPHLVVIDPVLASSAQRMRFCSCRALRMPDEGIVNPHLHQFELVDCGDVGSIKLLSSALELERIQMSGAFASDGVVGFLARLPKLKDIRIEYKKHYDFKFPLLG